MPPMNTDHTEVALGKQLEAASSRPDNLLGRLLRGVGKVAAVGGFGVAVLDSFAGWVIDATDISDISGIGIGVGILGLAAVGISSLVGRPNTEARRTQQMRH